MSMILVTGGAGFIGSHTVVELLNVGYDVVIMDNFSNSKPEALNRIRQITGKEFGFYEADMLDSKAMDRIFEENKIDAVIHFAGLKAVGESVQKPVEYYHHPDPSGSHGAGRLQKAGVLVLCYSIRSHKQGSLYRGYAHIGY